MNKKLAEITISALGKLGIISPTSYVGTWSTKRFHAIANFIEACEDYKLPCEWGDDQISAFLDRLDDKYYSVSTLDSQWNAIQQIGLDLGHPMSQDMKLEYLYVKNNCKEIKDDKVPVSRECLNQLCTAADINFTGYNCLLMKTMFLLAWAFSMRICEFSETKAKQIILSRSHNLRADTVRISNVGVSAAFLSDKSAKFGKHVKHRTVTWDKLPPYAKATIEAYMKPRPDASTFFCRFDGQPLNRDAVLNLLDACLLHSGWRKLHVIPHSFHQGRVSQKSLEGGDPVILHFDGCWVQGSTVFDVYVCSDIAALTP